MTEAEIMMNAVKKLRNTRMMYLKKLPLSGPPPTQWPDKGHIQIEGLRAGYRDGPDVLKGIQWV